MAKKRLVAIVGGIAVGKTTIGNKLLSSIESLKFIEEDVSKNEFLEDFYGDMKRWAFHSRISTLAMIASNYVLDNVSEDIILMDRCLDELITFARLQYEKGNLSDREFGVYCQLYSDIVAFAPEIDGYIYCHCDSALSIERIKKRDRKFEQGIDINYLDRLNQKYDNWIKTLNPQKVICVDTGKEIDIEKVIKFIEQI